MEANKVQTIENFYGVYLLYCTNPKYLGRTYVGYTVDPNRRIKQHNKGKQFGGAWRTSNKGPWIMVMVIHGFPNETTALRFEWAWQHPHVSRRLKRVFPKKVTKRTLKYCFQVLSEMLRTGPWHRLPLTIQWLSEDHAKEFPSDKSPPLHMPICYGAVISKKLSKSKNINEDEPNECGLEATCFLCNKVIIGRTLKCLNNNCDLECHLICLSKRFLKNSEYVPIEGKCPKCQLNVLWGDLIKKYKGCYQNVDINVNTDVADDYFDLDSD